ncbi:polysaccharide deacetylase family protein [Candidatus Saccharibacteria bacterium]|nr:polysaccharide deacetylase family protein [Candidatus Saccharibacteria bacterium]
MAGQILLSFDIEEFDFPREKGEKISLEEGVSVSDAGLKKIMQILEKQQVRATFFVTGNFARLRPQSVRAIVDAGHEVGAHGVDHFSPNESDISEAKNILERTLKGTGDKASKGRGQEYYRIHGWRQPRMQKIDFDELALRGYSYDSSINPIFLPGRYNHFSTPHEPYFVKTKVRDGSSATKNPIKRIVEIPASVATGLRIPMFWLSFHNFPFSTYLKLARSAISRDGYFATYFHPWEFTDLSIFPVVPRYIRRNSNDKLCSRLERLIAELKNDGHEFLTMGEFAEKELQKRHRCS